MTVSLADEYIGADVGDGYVITEKLAEGGMGALYLASHRMSAAKRKAIKVLLPEIAARPDILVRFEDEARAAINIQHPHVVEVDGYGYLPNGSPYIKMELLKGKDLRRYARERYGGPLSAAETLQVLAQICAGLEAAHRLGIVHRDLKPENVFVVETEDGSLFVKLLDFGIAKISESSLGGPIRTVIPSPMGTPGYWSPEQQLGTHAVDRRSDIWALGVIVYEMTTGHLPGLDAFTSGMFPPSLPSGWFAPLQSTLSLDPENRPESVRAFLNGLMAGLPGGHDLAQAAAPGLFRNAGYQDSTLQHPSGFPSAAPALAQAASAPAAVPTTLGAAAGAVASATDPARRRFGRWPLLLAATASAAAVLGIAATRDNEAPPQPAATPDAAPRPRPRLTVTTTPAGAQVTIDGQHRGMSPLTIEADPDSQLDVRLELDGYEPVNQTVRVERDRDLLVALPTATPPVDAGVPEIDAAPPPDAAPPRNVAPTQRKKRPRPAPQNGERPLPGNFDDVGDL